MIAFVKGKLIRVDPGYIIIEAAGLGYKVFIPSNLSERLPPLENELLLHTSLVVRELSQTLYGFLTSQECHCFEILLGITGIGPKLALSLVGHLSLEELYFAIEEENVSLLSKVPGIGKKTAERLIVELRGKLTSLVVTCCGPLQQTKVDPTSQKIHDAMSALIHLGYNQATAQKAIKNSMKDLPEGIPLADLITLALQHV